MYPSIQIGRAEYEARVRLLVDYLDGESLSGAVLFDNYHVDYFSGFAFIPTERPIALAISAQGESVLFVPRLELEHAQGEALVDRVEHYLEYPDDPRPMVRFQDMLAQMGIAGRVGRRHRWLSLDPGLPGAEPVGPDRRRGHSHWRLCGSPDGDQEPRRTGPHPRERQVEQPGPPAAATLYPRRRDRDRGEPACQPGGDPGPGGYPGVPSTAHGACSSQGAEAGYRGQIGRHAAIPHALAMNATFAAGDVLVTGASAAIWGYQAELERTMIIGPPSDEQRRFFEHMKAAPGGRL